ncbi:vitamin-D-receptor interacting mediator subunit 4-domain-containing protein [Limtongia smithiae]|uniref:vitamin-D-receptor interacting mediator subunit 4-domain-containing protein n=1 Tax=Limtongia smithiae TaxID=1125753 RepID=UPI0034CE7A7A
MAGPPRSLAAAVADHRARILATSTSEAPYTAATAPCLAIYPALDTFERALADLVSAVGHYRPGSVDVAKSLLSADSSLSTSVDELITFQHNTRTIAELQATSVALDKRLTGLLQSLADARAQLLAARGPSYDSDGDVSDDDSNDNPDTTTKKLPYSDLLDYATRIAKFSTAPESFLPDGWSGPYPRDMLAAATAVADHRLATETEPQSQPQSQHHAHTREANKSAYILEALAEMVKDVSSRPPSVPVNYPWPREDELRRGAMFLSVQDTALPS